MTDLASLPLDAVLPLGTRAVPRLARDAGRGGQRWLHADCSGARDKAAVMAAIAAGFGFPAWFGANLDALFDCLTDLEPVAGAARPGFVLVVEHLPAGPAFGEDDRDALLDVFRDAADRFSGRGIAFRTFWSVSRAERPAPP
jgi:RNAse (barnase) inhibitor barstar